MPDIKFSQLPDLPTPTPSTIIPVVESGQNFTVTVNTLQGFVNSTTGNVTAGNLVTSGQVSATGNISGNYIIGNGSQLTGITTNYGNANVTALLAAFGSNAVSTTGNVTAGFLVGDGSQITNLPSGNYSNANVAAYLPTYSGNISAGNIAVTGRITAATATATGTITGGNIATAGTVSATGNITGSYILGNGSQLTGINANYGNANVAAYLPTYTGAMTAMTGNVTTTANVQGVYIKGNGSELTGIVTSIVAGNGISINSSTGAVTVTATGGSSGGSGKVASSVTVGAYGSTTETLSASVLIPAGTFTTNDTLEIFSQWINNVGSAVQRYANIYISTTNAIPSNSTQIWGGIIQPLAYAYTKNWLRLEIINGTNNTRSFFSAGSAQSVNNTQVTALGTTSAGVNGGYTIPINWGVNQYIIFTGRNVNAAGTDSIANAGYQIYKG